MGSVAAGERAADFLTIVSSAVRNNLDVWAYVRDLLDRLLAGDRDYAALRPDCWAASHPEYVRLYRAEERRDRADAKQLRRADAAVRRIHGVESIWPSRGVRNGDPPECWAKGRVFAENLGDLLRLLARYGDLSSNGDNVQARLARSSETAFFPGGVLYRTPWAAAPSLVSAPPPRLPLPGQYPVTGGARARRPSARHATPGRDSAVSARL